MNKRLFCLDLLRGIDIFYLTVVSAILPPLFKVLGLSSAWKEFFCTHPWEGFTLYDLIMPLFIFMCGAAVPFALGRRMIDGKPTNEFHRHVWSRFALLWVLGMLAQGNLTTLDIHAISPYNNTLQTIAVGYVAAAYVLLIRSWVVRVSIPLVLTLVYGLILHFGGNYTKDGNVTQPIEHAILGAFLPADNLGMKQVAEGGYTWFLPSLMFPVIALAGSFSTEILRAKIGAWRRAAVLSGLGSGVLVLGLVLEFMGVCCVKHIFTVSFTLQAIGWSILSLAFLYVLTDIWTFRRGMGLLILFGQYALTAYLCKSVFGAACSAVAKRMFSGLNGYFDSEWAAVASAVEFGLVVIAVVCVRRKAAGTKGRDARLAMAD